MKAFTLLGIEAAKDNDLKGLVVPSESAREAAVVEGLEVIPVDSLSQAVAFFAGELELAPAPSRLEQLFEMYSVYDIDFGDVRGQESAKHAMTLAAAGRHNLIMIGPPGSGKPGDIETNPYDDPAVALLFRFERGTAASAKVHRFRSFADFVADHLHSGYKRGSLNQR